MAFQIRRGLEADLPASPLDGELLYSTDTNKLYVGFGGTANAVTSTGLSLTGLSVTDVGGDGSLTYNNTTGVFTYTGPSATEVRAHFSAGTGISITNGAIASTITQYTDALARAAVSAGTGLSYDSSTGVISIEQAVGTTSNVTFNDLTVSGNLTVQGTTTTVNSTTINLADNIITLNSNATGSASQNAGIEVERGDDANVSIRWNETSNAWQITNDGTTYNNISSFSGNYADLTGTPTLATVATSGLYTDLTGTPTLFSGSYDDLTNKPTLATVATSGSYDDLTNKPTLTTNLDGLTDVVITSATVGQVLKYDGTNWINDTDATGGGGGGGTSTNGWTYSASGVTGLNFLLGTDSTDAALTLPNASIPGGLYDGGKNVLIGHRLGNAITNGWDNVMIGTYLAPALTGGYANIGIGTWHSRCLTTGSYNITLGQWGGYWTTGNHNISIGSEAGSLGTTGNYNIILGYRAGGFGGNVSGSSNILIGNFSAAPGQLNTFVGAYARVPDTSVETCCATGIGAYAWANSWSTAIGVDAYADQPYEVMIGYRACSVAGCFGFPTFNQGSIGIGYCAVAGAASITIGHKAGPQPECLPYCSSGYSYYGSSVLIGAYAGQCLTSTPQRPTMLIGNEAGMRSTKSGMLFIGNFTGSFSCPTELWNVNVLIGHGVGYNLTTGNDNLIIGSEHASSNADNRHCDCMTTGSNNTHIGIGAGVRITTGDQNVMLGFETGYKLQQNSSFNISIGNYAGGSWFWADKMLADNSNYNVFIGQNAAGDSGSAAATYTSLNNVILGPYAGYCIAQLNNSHDNTMIGYSAGYNLRAGSNNIAIGCGAGPATTNCNVSNTIWMGNSSITNANIQVAWTVTSDVRDKCVIGPVTRGKDFLRNINPIEYTFKDRNTDSVYDLKKRYGFSANELLDLEGSDPVIVTDHDPDKLRITTDYLVPVLVNAIKELSDSIDSLNSEVHGLKGILGLTS